MKLAKENLHQTKMVQNERIRRKEIKFAKGVRFFQNRPQTVIKSTRENLKHQNDQVESGIKVRKSKY